MFTVLETQRADKYIHFKFPKHSLVKMYILAFMFSYTEPFIYVQVSIINARFIEEIEGFLIFVVFQTQHVACHLERTQLMFTGFN